MEVKENRPDACAASGTANSIYKDFSTDAPDIQEELTGPVLPDECAADIVSFCSEQTIAYDDLLEYATLFYLQDKDPEDPPFRETLKFELLTLTNSCIALRPFTSMPAMASGFFSRIFSTRRHSHDVGRCAVRLRFVTE